MYEDPEIGIRADTGDKHEAGDAGRDRLPRYGFGPLHVHGLEGHATLFDIGRDRIDYGVSSRNGGGDRGLIAHIGGDNRDPVESHRSQLNPRRVRMPHSDAYSHALGGQAVHPLGGLCAIGRCAFDSSHLSSAD